MWYAETQITHMEKEKTAQPKLASTPVGITAS